MGRKQRKKLVRKSALRIRIAIGAPTRTKHRQLKPLAHRRHGSMMIRWSRAVSTLTACCSLSVWTGIVMSSRPERIAIATFAAAVSSKDSMRRSCSARALGKSAMAISEGLVEVAPLRLTVSRGISRVSSSGNTALTSPTLSVPLRQVIVSTPLAASACIVAFSAETVTGSPVSGW